MTVTRNGVGLSTTSSSVSLDHSIVYGNSTEVMGADCAVFRFSDVGIDCSGVNGNLFVDPGFVDAESGNLRLSATSAILDQGALLDQFTGDPCYDMDGAPRAIDGNGDGIVRPDPGAFEFSDAFERARDITGLYFDQNQSMRWDDTADRFNIYRGYLGDLEYGHSGECFVSRLQSPQFHDFDEPSPGSGFFYSVSGETEAGNEGPLGYGMCAERSNGEPCP